MGRWGRGRGVRKAVGWPWRVGRSELGLRVSVMCTWAEDQALHSPFTAVGSGSGPRILWSPGSHKEIRGAGGAPWGPRWNGLVAHTSAGAGLGAEGV